MGVGGVHALPGCALTAIRLAEPAGAAGSALPGRWCPGRQCPGREHPGRQFIPISTAILIRSEWFLAPNFCLSRDVVLATVL